MNFWVIFQTYLPSSFTVAHNNKLFLTAHVRKFTSNQKVSKGGRWNNEQDTEASLKAKLGAAFDSKIETIRQTAKK